MIDIVLLNIPKMEVHNPLIASAAIKAVLNENNISSICLDMNVDLWNALRKECPEFWDNDDQTIHNRELFEEWWYEYGNYVVDWLNENVKKVNPKFVGITILSHWQHKICERIIKLLPDQKIILGGPGVNVNNFAQLQNVYAYVEGEAENVIVPVINGQTDIPGVNGRPPVQLLDLNTLPFPDYSDFDLTKYSHKFRNVYDSPNGADFLYVTASRGCIRKCTFCDVAKHWPSFITKSGKTIAREIMHQHLKHNIKSFYFTDSLINGNMKVLKDLVDEINKLELDIDWAGQFIVRPPNVMSPSNFDELKRSGCKRLLLGVESYSQRVLNHMKKGMRTVDVDYTIEQCSRLGIQVVPMMIVGYITETDEDHQANKDFLIKNKKYVEDGTIYQISLGPTLRIYDGTPLADHFDEQELDRSDEGGWVYNDNTEKVRIERWFELKNLAKNLGYKLAIESPKFLKRRYKNITGLDIE